MYLLVFLRVGIGWHFLYEGLSKLLTPGWSASGYLTNSTGFLSSMFHSLAQNEVSLSIINFLNVWGLILIGLGLFIGLFTRAAQIAGIGLISVYYLANPPWLSNPGSGFEGSYLVVSKDLLEIIALIVLSYFPTGKFLGMDGLIKGIARGGYQRVNHFTNQEKQAPEVQDVSIIRRREILKHLATLPLLGGFSLAVASKFKKFSNEEQNLADAISGASVKRFEFKQIDELKGELPKGRIKDKVFSKVILGGNLMNGWAHSRDLIYVSSLVRAYHTKEKIFSTFNLAEKCGVNTLLSHPVIAPVINEYWDKGYGKIQFISDLVGLNYDENGQPSPKSYEEYLDLVKKVIDQGAAAAYIQGETADYYINQGLVDDIVKVLDLVRDAGLPAGIGAHRIETVKQCAELGLETDFWMKTLHNHNYWSAQHPEWHDNMYCYKPQETIEFMKTLPQPFIAFKVLAAGALKPEEAFRYAFQNGADFICVGMYDFQMVEDVNLALDALEAARNRERVWVA